MPTQALKSYLKEILCIYNVHVHYVAFCGPKPVTAKDNMKKVHKVKRKKKKGKTQEQMK